MGLEVTQWVFSLIVLFSIFVLLWSVIVLLFGVPEDVAELEKLRRPVEIIVRETQQEAEQLLWDLEHGKALVDPRGFMQERMNSVLIQTRSLVRLSGNWLALAAFLGFSLAYSLIWLKTRVAANPDDLRLLVGVEMMIRCQVDPQGD